LRRKKRRKPIRVKRNKNLNWFRRAPHPCGANPNHVSGIYKTTISLEAKMKKKSFFVAMLAMGLAFGLVLTGCDNGTGGGGGGGSSIPSALVGVWGASGLSSTTIEFRSNGDFLMLGQGGYTASVSGNTVTVSAIGVHYGTFDYSISGSAMTISNGTSSLSTFPALSPWNKQ
jgi:hypothetical protein